jgi:signal transduction histidine kinase/CheY-like chemotaxis protein
MIPTDPGTPIHLPRQAPWRRSQDLTLLLTREVIACVVRAEDEHALYQSICRVIVERGGYLLAAIFETRPEEQRIEVLHAQGPARDYLDDIDIRLDDTPAGRGPSPLAARTGRVVAINDVATDPRHAFWNERARPYGIESLASIPLKVQGQVRWLLTIYAGKKNAFDPTEIELLELLANDVAYGIEALRTRHERDQAALLARHELAARHAAEEASRAKSEFISHMSHELRTPLNAVLGFSALMRRDPAITAVQRRNLQIIHRSGEHLLDLVNSILDMSKIEAGRMALEISAFDLDALVGDVADMMRARAQEKGLGLVLDVQDQLVRHLRADPVKLRQIIINLLSNAIKFTEHGSVRMQLRQQRDAQGGLLLTIQVRDSGVGLQAQDMARIFEPFVQVGAPSTQDGTGLGLAITRQFIELMNGRISVQSAPGQGSTFQVSLPVTEAAGADVPAAVPAAAGDIAGLAPGQADWRILVIEDRQDNALLLARLLEEIGLEVRVAPHAGAGIGTFQQWQPHFIWMDLNMPGMDGLQATQQIRALPGGANVKIALVTAATLSAPHQAQMARSGIDALVRKPYAPREIYACMARLLGMRYVYRQSAAPEPSAVPAALTAQRLAALPPALREALRNALISLDSRRIDAVIAQAAQCDGALGELLARHAGQYHYTPILAALETHMELPA